MGGPRARAATTIGAVAAAVCAFAPAVAAAAWAPDREGGERAAARFAAVDPALLKRNGAFSAGRAIEPHLTPMRRSYGQLISRLAGALAEGVVYREMLTPVFGGAREEAGIGLDAAWSSVRELQVGGGAIVDDGAAPATDALVRALPLGFSTYLLLRGPHAPEKISLSAHVACGLGGEDMFRKLEAGTFGAEANGSEEAECRAYSHGPVAATAPAPEDTRANLEHERAVLRLARRHARYDGASVAFALAAYQARDARGGPVRTELSWREPEEPVLRVRHRSARQAYPVLVRLDQFADR